MPVFDIVTEALGQMLKRMETEKKVAAIAREMQVRDRMYSLMVHDLRSTITTTLLCADVIDRQRVNSEACHEMVTRIIKSMSRADQMVKTGLEYSRLVSQNRSGIKKESVDLVALVEQLLDELSFVYGDRFVLRVNAAGSTPQFTGYWNADALWRCFENLIVNAVKYGASDSKITVTLSGGTSFVHLCVHNAGGELNDREIKSLFKWFGAGSNARSDAWGLGLMLVKEVADAHGGNVKVESLPGRGTSFTVQLPRGLC